MNFNQFFIVEICTTHSGNDQIDFFKLQYNLAIK